jgi:hypothetical protein
MSKIFIVRLPPRSHLKRLVVVILLGVALTLPLVLWTLPLESYQDSRLRQNLVRHLWARHRIRVRPADLIFPGGEPQASGLAPREAYFLGREQGQPNRDVFFAHFILSDHAIPVHASPAFSLSKTAAADEQGLTLGDGRFLAYASAIKGRTSVVTVLDLHGLSPEAMDSFSRTQRLQQRLTNWQDTGRLSGLDRLEVRLTAPRRVRLAWEGGGRRLKITAVSGRWEALVDARSGKVLSGPASSRRLRVGQRDFLPWAVDTMRAFSFVGPERIAWLEDLVYGIVDQARRISGEKVSISEIRDEMDLPVVKHTGGERIEGWPPPRLKPIVRPSLKGEGRWREVKGAFLRSQPGKPSLFAMTFVRPDKERPFSRVYFLAWDPRRVELRMRGGTREPRSATGQRGDGKIPRDPEILRRLVGAFNGGFQSTHGDFGMMVDRQLLVPAKPWAATVARLADGTTAFGTWDGANFRHGWTPRWIQSYRQNLTPMVEDGKFNPWKRLSWGGGAGFYTGQGPSAFVIRSGICLHNSGHLMYVQGDPVDGATLGLTMWRVGCDYGLELDINKGHVGFEFYNVRAPGEKPPPGGSKFRTIRYFSQKDAFPGAPGFFYYMREVVRGTGNPCPRWVRREARDFFYLLERRLLPSPDLPYISGQNKEGRWTAAGLPAGALSFPRAMARTWLAPAKEEPVLRVHLLELDLRWLQTELCVPGEGGDCLGQQQLRPKGGDPALAVLPLGSFDGRRRSLLADGRLVRGAGGPGRYLALEPWRPGGPALPRLKRAPATSVGSLSVQQSSADSEAAAGAPVETRAALCPLRERLLYATGLGVSDGQLEAALKHAGCTGVLQLGHAQPMVLPLKSGLTTVLGQVLPPGAHTPSLVFSRSSTRYGTRIFTHTKVQPHWLWNRVQPERTRSSVLRAANRRIKTLGLEPIKKLTALCKRPYDQHPELVKLRWVDPITGRPTCPGDKWGKRRVKVKRPK